MEKAARLRGCEAGAVFVEPTEDGRAKVVFDGWEIAEAPLETAPHMALAEALYFATLGKASSISFEVEGDGIAEISFSPDRDAYCVDWADGSRTEGFANFHVALLQCLCRIEDNVFSLTPGALEAARAAEAAKKPGGKWKVVKPVLDEVREWRWKVDKTPTVRLCKAVDAIRAEKMAKIHKLGEDVGEIFNLAGPLVYLNEHGVQLLEYLESDELAKLTTMENDRIAGLLWAAAEDRYHADFSRQYDDEDDSYRAKAMFLNRLESIG